MTTTLRTAAEAERQAERLRADLAGTLDQIADNLAPQRLASEAAASVKARTPPWLQDYWRLATGPVGLGVIGAAAASIAVGVLARSRRR